MIMNHSSVLKDILTGKIYNEETYYKRIASSIYKIKNIDWKVFKTYCNPGEYGVYIKLPSLFDLKDFTVSFENSLRVIANLINNIDDSKIQLINDSLQYAIRLGEKINLNWSQKRLQSEHSRQIEQVKMGEIKNKSKDPIHESFPEYENIKLINSERDIFKESLIMHHCLYNCYKNSILNKNYVAYHIIYNLKEYTLGLSNVNNKVVIDQLYGIYDTKPTEDAISYANRFVEIYQNDLQKLFYNNIYSK